MPQIINTNLASLTAQNALNNSQNTLNTAMQQLSTGLSINSAADNAAGLAIVTGMQSQINGDAVAVQNANDGISMAQTAGSALSQITNDLQTIRQLAVQSSNGTNTASNREQINTEVQQEVAEVSRISQQTSFNGLSLLTGQMGNATFQIGADVGQVVNMDFSQGTQANQIGQTAVATADVSNAFGGSVSLGNQDIGIQIGTGSFAYVAQGSYSSASSLSTAINAAYLAAGGTAGTSLTTVNAGGQLVFSNSSTTDAVNISAGGGAANLGLPTTVAAEAAAVAGTASVTQSGYTGAPLSVAGNGDLTVTVGSKTVNVAGGTYATATDLATAINTAYTAAGGTGSLATGTNGTGGPPVTGGKISFADPNAATVSIGGSLATSTTGLDLASGTLAAGTGGVPITADSTGVAAAMTQNTVQIGSGALSLAVGGSTYNIQGSFQNSQDLVAAINSEAIPGVQAYLDSTGNLQLTSQSAVTVSGSMAGTGVGNLGFSSTGTAIQTSGSLQGGDVLTVDHSNAMIATVDAAIAQVSTLQSNLGAMQNRFNSVVSNLQSGSENLSASQSSIEDTNFAAVTAMLSRSQILQQSGISMLAQANSQPQLVLKLLQ